MRNKYVKIVLDIGSDFRLVLSHAGTTAETADFSIARDPVISGVSFQNQENHRIYDWGRGQPEVAIRWSGLPATAQVKIELLKAGRLLRTIARSVPSTGSYNYNVSMALAGGNDYRVRVTSPNHEGVSAESRTFTVYTWKKVRTRGSRWPARNAHTSVVFNNKIWVMGGYEGSRDYDFRNDVWSSSDGITWTEVKANNKVG